MIKTSKRYQSAHGGFDRMKTYTLEEAADILKQMPSANFDETVELSTHLAVDSRQSDQMVRGIINLPNGSGKKVKVIVFTDDESTALEAGADIAGLAELIKKVKDGWVDFDVAVATPAAMKDVRVVARVLGPRGLMPNPKSGTVTDDIVGAIKDIKQGGRVEYKMDKTSNIGIVVGKRSFDTDKLIENIKTAIDAVGQSRPEVLKGKYILSMSISSTMSPGIKLTSSIYSNY